MKQRALVSITLAFMLAFVATGAQFSLVTVSTAASNGGSDPIVTLAPAVPDFSDHLNSTLTQAQLRSQGNWSFDGSAPVVGGSYRFNENSSGLHIGVQSPPAGNWSGYFAQTPTSGINAMTATVTITAPSQLSGTGFFVTGLYIQTADPSSLNYTSIGAVTSSAGTVWEVTNATGNSVTSTGTVLWTDPDANQSTTMNCTMSTNGDNYLQVELNGSVVYESSDLSLQMPSPFLWFLEVQSDIPSKMNYGTFLNFTSTDLGFEPANVTVSAGSTVQWVVPVGYDTITSDSGGWTSPALSSGESFNYTFNTTGVYGYHSEEHPWASGTITVLDPPAFAVVRGQNNGIYLRTYNSSLNTWTDWTNLPGATSETPAAAVSGGALHIVVLGMNGHLYYANVNQTSGMFSGWSILSDPLSGPTPSAPALTSNSTTLILVVRGQDDLIYYRFYTVATGTWTNWANVLGGSTPDTPAVATLGNMLYLVVVGTNGALYSTSMDLTTMVSTGWQWLGGQTSSPPTLTASQSLNEVCLVVRGMNDNIYLNVWNSGWTGWLQFPSGTTIDGIGATVIGGTLQVIVRGSDGVSLYHGSMDLSTHTFTGWDWISGSTPSKPTLVG